MFSKNSGNSRTLSLILVSVIIKAEDRGLQTTLEDSDRFILTVLSPAFLLSHQRFFRVTPMPAPLMSKKIVSRSGLVVMASMYFGSGAG